ncbi:hypothetical protein KG892_04645 [Vermiphilus pyriformis]|uniref:Uncharacterized protein n=1 Tax=candidate division TM6 bacterium JCVI TM6SC1 TaxID=1306947 RepID=A0A0D2I205_9BACT|nr:hypothetical protein J120_02605 [candidate division TM6 bacterium JCVI TM6SC1]UNE35248.1 MAG: hypothetical protein KG892_04645 [Vermiphilus pyriformis]
MKNVCRLMILSLAAVSLVNAESGKVMSPADYQKHYGVSQANTSPKAQARNVRNKYDKYAQQGKKYDPSGWMGTHKKDLVREGGSKNVHAKYDEHKRKIGTGKYSDKYMEAHSPRDWNGRRDVQGKSAATSEYRRGLSKPAVENNRKLFSREYDTMKHDPRQWKGRPDVQGINGLATPK